MGIAELLAILMSHGCPWEWHSSVPSAFRKHVLGVVWQLAGLIMFAIIFSLLFIVFVNTLRLCVFCC